LKEPSKIREFLLIAPLDFVSHRDLLKSIGITHLINCTSRETLYPVEFISMSVPLTVGHPEILVESLNNIVSFINEAKIRKGKVLVYSDTGTNRSAAVVIAFLMVTKNWTYFESFIFVRNCRYVIDPDARYVKELCKYYNSKQIRNFQQYQCLCGACAFTVTHSFFQAYFQNPISCCCTFEHPSPNCPNMGCYDFLQKNAKIL